MTEAGKARRRKKRMREIRIAKAIIEILFLIGCAAFLSVEQHLWCGYVSMVSFCLGYIVAYIEIPGIRRKKKVSGNPDFRIPESERTKFQP